MEKLREQGGYVPAKRFIIQFSDPIPGQGVIITPPGPEVLEEAKGRILLMLIIINTGILGLSGIAGYLLAGLTLKPIKNMVDEQNRFITDASHELRTPLTSLRSEIEVSLRDKKLTLAESKKILESNLEEVRNLQYLSDNLIKLAQTHKPNGIKFERLSLLRISEESVKKVEKLAKKKNIKIVNSISDVGIFGDKLSLTELFVIFLDNAIKYSQENTEISLTSKKSGMFVLIDIKDQGAGIEKGDLPFLFDRFYRADKARTEDGFGLGLSIAKEIVDRHNGTIDVKTKTGIGTTFRIKLPLKS